MADKNWRDEIKQRMNGYCEGCDVCNGVACAGRLPGMGGLGRALTFQNNFLSWEDLDVDISGVRMPEIGTAPMTGAEENMGACFSEKKFHLYIVKGAGEEGILPCIGDGTPDFKLEFGAEALRINGLKGAVFIKPYSNEEIINRYKRVEDAACFAGLDIDSYNLKTMDGKAVLGKKTVSDLKYIKRKISVPFVVKGVALEEDVVMMEELEPDIVVVSNHGGRIRDNMEGIACTLKKYSKRLKRICGELWVDGGLRKKDHLLKAAALGADRVLIGRPFIQGVSVFRDRGVKIVLERQFLLS